MFTAEWPAAGLVGLVGSVTLIRSGAGSMQVLLTPKALVAHSTEAELALLDFPLGWAPG